MKAVKVQSLDEFKKLVADWSESFAPKSIVLLNGPMGAGKTEFVKTFCHLHGIEDVASPTFAIHHHYENAKIKIDHLDLYRIEGEDDLEGAGFWDLFTQESAIIFIEWSEKMNITQLPADWTFYNVDIEVLEDSSRIMSMSKPL